MNKAVFLDRDGTINEDFGYINHPNQVKLLPRSAEAIKLLKEAGYKIIIITNQSGIARGFLSEDMLQTVDKTIQKEILKSGGFLDDIYYCPHHPDFGVYPYKQKCDCRKPFNSLILKASKDHNIDLKNSFMVGDKLSDVESGIKSGTKTILVLTGQGENEKKSKEIEKNKPTFIANNLYDAVKWLIKNGNGK